MSKTLLKDSDDNILGLASGSPGDPRLVTISDEDYDALGSLVDRRGAPRYMWNSGTSSCDLIAVEDRVVPAEIVFQAWKMWADMKSAKEADTGLSGDLLTYVTGEVNKLESVYSELTRAGNSGDEP